MSNDGGSGDEGPSDFDRMSLNSLKRELEVQKAQTQMARDEARERLREEEKKAKAFPWAIVLGGTLGGLVLVLGLVYVLRESMPTVAVAMLPAFVYTPTDAGLRDLLHDSGVHPVDAGVDAAAAATTHHSGHPHPHASEAPGGDLHLDLGGDESDPIGGVQ
jgi:hypothetical protein